MEDKAILLEPDGSFVAGPGYWAGIYSHRLVGLWWGREKLFNAASMQMTSLQLMKLAILVDNLSKEG